jgi:hypothetical protein
MQGAGHGWSVSVSDGPIKGFYPYGVETAVLFGWQPRLPTDWGYVTANPGLRFLWLFVTKLCAGFHFGALQHSLFASSDALCGYGWVPAASIFMRIKVSF